VEVARNRLAADLCVFIFGMIVLLLCRPRSARTATDADRGRRERRPRCEGVA
jgi:hypothetical protein